MGPQDIVQIANLARRFAARCLEAALIHPPGPHERFMLRQVEYWEALAHNLERQAKSLTEILVLSALPPHGTEANIRPAPREWLPPNRSLAPTCQLITNADEVIGFFDGEGDAFEL